MKKIILAVYLAMMVAGFGLNQYILSGTEYSEEFEIMVESKVKAPQGARWVVSNDTRYQLVTFEGVRSIFI